MVFKELSEKFHVSWSQLKIEEFEEQLDEAMRMGQTRIDAIEQLSDDKVGYLNVAKALSDSTDELDVLWSVIEHLNNVMDSPELREVYRKVLPKVTDFYAGISRRPKLANRVETLANGAGYKDLNLLEKKHVDELLLDFEESGASLEEATREVVREIDNELAKITQQYSENVLDATNAWELVIEDEEKVSCLPESAREMARENALQKGMGSIEYPKWRFTLQVPSLMPLLKYMDDGEIRKKAWTASVLVGSEGKWENTGLIKEILELRKKKAEILGSDQFADLVLKRRMAKSGLQAKAFVKKMQAAVAPSVPVEVEELERFRADELGLTSAEKIEPWDVAYWSEKMQQTKYAFEDEQLRPYFSVDQVVRGMFDLASRLFGLKIEDRLTHVGEDGPEGSVEVWTSEVQYYDVYDEDTNRHFGGFYTDWFPRESKRGGAWMGSLKSSEYDSAGNRIQNMLGVLCGNMTPGRGGKPAQLTHYEVETVFHEFGHLLHGICGEVPISYLNGISVPWDFVEVPSQIMENWCWQRESLDCFAKHAETGKPIPEELFEKMRTTRNFQKALAVLRQLNFGITDLELHLSYDSNGDLDEFIDRITDGYRPEWKSHSPSIVRRFGHLFSDAVGYAAGYYSYQWSEVLEADAFERFLEEGILNGDIGREFRKYVFSSGNSKDPMESFINFRGKAPTFEAYMKRASLEVTEASKLPFGN